MDRETPSGCLVRGIASSKMRWCIIGLFLKFNEMTLFLVLVLMRNKMVIDQLISLYKPHKNIRIKKMMDELITQTKEPSTVQWWPLTSYELLFFLWTGGKRI